MNGLDKIKIVSNLYVQNKPIEMSTKVIFKEKKHGRRRV